MDISSSHKLRKAAAYTGKLLKLHISFRNLHQTAPATWLVKKSFDFKWTRKHLIASKQVYPGATVKGRSRVTQDISDVAM